jgi:small subunit ribosomal protein S9
MATAATEEPKASKTPGVSLGTGRRKTSVARVRVRSGSGKITINDRPLDEYFRVIQQRSDVEAPLKATGHRDDVDIIIRVAGGGPTGQAGACKLGIARALRLHDPASFDALRGGGLLTRDSRMIERKKYGLHKARKATQFSKR